MENKLISIIIPIYKVEKYLCKCIDSILNQTYKNLEIILVDDGSPDGCPKICDEYSKSDSRVRTIHKNNGGLSDARNAGIDIAQGDYLAFVDSDDWVDLDMYRRLIEACERNNSEISVCGYYEVHNDKLKLHSICTDEITLDFENATKELIDDKTFHNYAWNKLFKADLFLNVRYPFGHNMEDVYTTYKMFMKAIRVTLIETAFYYYVVNREGSILSELSIKSKYDLFLSHKSRFEILSAKFPDKKDVLFRNIVFSALRVAKAYSKSNEKIKYQVEYTEAKMFLSINKNDIYRNMLISKSDRIKFKLFFINKSLPETAEFLYSVLKKTKIKKFYTIIHMFLYKKHISRHEKHKWDFDLPKTFLIGIPEHNNLGDHAITMAERAFLNKLEPHREVITVSESKYSVYKTILKRSIKHHDIIVLTGGGDIGNQYLYIEKRRRDIIKSFPNNKIVIFPQTIYFTEDYKGKAELENSKSIYGSHNNLTFCTREKVSYEFALQNFRKNNIVLCPDIVLYLNKSEPNFYRNGILLCIRSDVEGQLNIDDIMSLKDTCMKYYDKVDTTDTAIYETVRLENQEAMIEEKLRQFKSHRLIVTDRLHGVIFSAITGTPCVAIGNYNHKIVGICEWLKLLDYIKYAESLEEAKEMIKQFSNDDKTYSYSNDYIKSYFNDLESLLNR